MNYVFVNEIFTSIDAVYFLICVPSPFTFGWFLHKFNGPAVRYEVAIDIEQGKKVWTNGLLMAGTNSNLKNFKSKLENELS